MHGQKRGSISGESYLSASAGIGTDPRLPLLAARRLLLSSKCLENFTVKGSLEKTAKEVVTEEVKATCSVGPLPSHSLYLESALPRLQEPPKQ